MTIADKFMLLGLVIGFAVGIGQLAAWYFKDEASRYPTDTPEDFAASAKMRADWEARESKWGKP
jgi:hypothetical protein